MSKRPVPVGTTKRKPLTPRQRSELWNREGGLCCICKQFVDKSKPFIDEHKRALGLAGSNDADNRGIAHVHCAEIKTREEDMPRINKAKAQGAAVVSRDPLAHPKLQGRNSFAKAPPKPGKIDKSALPPLGLSEIARRYEAKP